MKTYKLSEKIGVITIYIVLTIIGIITLYPFINVLVLSFNDATDAVGGGIYLWPRVFSLANYAKVFSYPNLITAFTNSLLRTVIGTSLNVFLTSMIAYTLSRRDFILRKVITVMFVITMYVSGGMVPNYILIQKLHLFDNFLVYIVPGLVWAFAVFIMRSYIDSLPMSIQESAMIDGANDFVIFLKIILPLCVPTLATIALFYSVAHWNSWFDTYLYCSNDASLTTLQYELQRIIQNATATAASKNLNYQQLKDSALVTPVSIQMAVTIVVITPIICVYPFVQKYFIKGMTLGSVKG